MTTPLPNLIPLKDVAAQLGMPPRRLRDRRKQFTHVRIGKELYLTDGQLADLIEQFTVPSDTTSRRKRDLEKTQERQSRRRGPIPGQRRPAA
ncbi:hypothetical protein [Micromonospora sp. C41]|uniref:hypothetical protein n=1 Tax=Micromonospora sp. C41 TaxID=2824878 RepID=UPI001B373872|nr:hypothetical protein [Micromonospora sp. C41]MBQ1064519.1 hypothetical protein [Micromonospora sp. C41]